jgi:Uma2 family endonuclease
MAVAELISAEQYLHTSFEHDAEFVEGRIIERPVPTFEHSSLQIFLGRELWAVDRRLGVRSLTEQRVQTQPDHFRIPDVCVITERPDARARGIVTKPPYLCIEILSPEDTAVETMEKVREYLSFGVEWVWVIDPVSLAGQVHSRTSAANIENKIFSTDKFSLDISGVEY